MSYDCLNNHFYTFKETFSLEMCGNSIKVVCPFERLIISFDEQDDIDYMLESIISSFIITTKINRSDFKLSSLEF